MKKLNNILLSLLLVFSMIACSAVTVIAQEVSVDQYIEILQKNPKDAEAVFNVGVAYLNKKDLISAEEYFNKALVLYPEFSETYAALGSIYYESNDYTKAIEFFKKAIEIDPRDYNSIFYLGVSYNANGNKKASSEQVVKLKKIRRNHLSRDLEKIINKTT